jgi:hypothetical protein
MGVKYGSDDLGLGWIKWNGYLETWHCLHHQLLQWVHPDINRHQRFQLLQKLQNAIRSV